MKVSVARRYVFEAHHHLDGAPSPWCYDHPHHYTVEVVCAGDVTDLGMVIDTDVVDGRWRHLSPHLAGRDLNDYLPVVTTVESIATWLLERFPEASSVTVWEDQARWGRAER